VRVLEENLNQSETTVCILSQQYCHGSEDFINGEPTTTRGRTKVLHWRKQENFHLINRSTLARELNAQYYMTFPLWNESQKEAAVTFRYQVGMNPFLMKDDVNYWDEAAEKLEQ
jgi:hypothetical protein